jgi:uracil-DNA glycosylase
MIAIRDDLLASGNFYPEKDKIFRVFEMPFSAIRVIILGQDPYPREYQANGLAFAVNEGMFIPASLRVIHNEIQKEGLATMEDLGHWGTLEHWHKQGVFLLNSALTVRKGESGTHLKDWCWFTKEIIKVISLYLSPVWLMWGAKARAFVGNIHGYYLWHDKFKGKTYSYVLLADHPASESYSTTAHFTGCMHFSTTNEILRLKGEEPINW